MTRWLALVVGACVAQAQTLDLVTTDIDNFWIAYDASEPGNRSGAFQSTYFDNASPGLRDFIRLRIGTADDLAATVERYPKFFASVRTNTLRIESQRELIGVYASCFKRLYPLAVLPSVYFVIGPVSTGGTVGPSGLLIGAEVFSLGPDVDSSEIQQANPVFHRAMGSIDRLPLIVAHELVHFQQRFSGRRTLLAMSMIEGAADYIANRVSGRTINHQIRDYAESRRKELFQRFAGDLARRPDSLEGWLHNYSFELGEPPDLGYWIGAEICLDYFTRAADKAAAIDAIIRMAEPEAIVRGSRYAWILR